MSNITSSAYPVVSVSKAGDQFTIVQGGQLKKLTRGGLQQYITGETLKTVRAGGSTANRPTAPATFATYFDTTIGKPIWYDGVNWVDATGATV
jgi:septal ring-binding cell division protein DamX